MKGKSVMLAGAVLLVGSVSAVCLCRHSVQRTTHPSTNSKIEAARLEAEKMKLQGELSEITRKDCDHDAGTVKRKRIRDGKSFQWCECNCRGE